MIRSISAASLFTLLFSLALALAGCGGATGAAEGIIDEQAKARQEISATVDAIADEAGAKEALPKIEAAVSKINALQEKLNALNLTSDQMQKVRSKILAPNIEMNNKLDELRLRSDAAYKLIIAAVDKPK
jgi:hypothetical protein